MISFDAIGTSWKIDFFEQVASIDFKNLKKEILERIDKFDRNYSRFRQDSWVSLMSTKTGSYFVPDDGKIMLDLYHKLYLLTESQMTPLIGFAMEDSGYDASYSLKPKKIRPVPKWEDAMNYNFPNLEIKKQVLFDFGAMGKGYLVDIVGNLIQSMGIKKYCIDAGGDILYKTDTKERLTIGLEHPDNQNEVIGVVEIENEAICGSAGNRRNWGKYNHILNSLTKTSPTHILATWIIAETTILADALSTAVYFADPKMLQREFQFEYLILNQNYTVSKSSKFPAKLYYTKE